METRRRFLVAIEQDEDGIYAASVSALRGCHTQARTLEELIPRIREAVALCLEVEEPEEPPMYFVGVQQVDVTV